MMIGSMDFTTEQIILIASWFIGANGSLYVVFKGVIHLINKWIQKRNKDKEIPFARTSDCIMLHNELIDSIKIMINEVTSEMKLLSIDIKDMTKERTFEDDIRRRRDVIISNAVGCISNSKGVHDFAIHKAERFIQFVLENYKTICCSDYCVFEERIKSLALAVKEEGRAICGDDYVDFFYNNYHVKSTSRYLEDVNDIFEDMVNNKSERFALVSVEFLQRFMSEMVKAYIEWVQNSCNNAMNAMIVFKESRELSKEESICL